MTVSHLGRSRLARSLSWYRCEAGRFNCASSSAILAKSCAVWSDMAGGAAAMGNAGLVLAGSPGLTADLGERVVSL